MILHTHAQAISAAAVRVLFSIEKAEAISIEIRSIRSQIALVLFIIAQGRL